MEINFPRHNGHRAWPYYSETVEEAAVEDLFWRNVQTNSRLVIDLAKAVNLQAEVRQHEIVLTPNLSVSLLPESCGAYARHEFNNLCYLYGNYNDDNYIMEGTRNPDLASYYLGPLIAKCRGWMPKNVVRNLMQEVGKHMTASDRFHFNLKAKHNQILIEKFSEAEIKVTIERAYPVLNGLSGYEVYWYKTENGSITHGIVYFNGSVGNKYKLPISAWKPEFPTRRQTVVYDMLNIARPYPLYNLDRIVHISGSMYAIVCTSEAHADYISEKHRWISEFLPITTYSSIGDTNWNKLEGRTLIIFPEASKQGCCEAFRLHADLEKRGFKTLFLRRQKGAMFGDLQFDQDLVKMADPNFGCSFSEFVEHCYQEFGALPPEGLLPKAISLSSLPESAVVPENLMDGLLDSGEQLMIHAWRGVGKSLFAMLLALCFASGKSALNGRICPSRKYRVLLLDGEMSADSLKKRAHALCCGHALPLEAMDDLKVRSQIVERKTLELETDEGFAELKPDLAVADIIIVDSVFKFFPTAMNSEFVAVEKLLDFLDRCRKLGKTSILIDHEGKGRGTSFGTMGKEIALDVVLRLCKDKSGHVIEANVQKIRAHAEPLGAYLKMRIEASDKGKNITFQVCDEHKVEAALEGESSVSDDVPDGLESSAKLALPLEEAIIKYVSEKPNAVQKEIVKDLMERGYGGRSTIHARIKDLSEAGKLPHWQNRRKKQKVAEPPAPGVDEK